MIRSSSAAATRCAKAADRVSPRSSSTTRRKTCSTAAAIAAPQTAAPSAYQDEPARVRPAPANDRRSSSGPHRRNRRGFADPGGRRVLFQQVDELVYVVRAAKVLPHHRAPFRRMPTRRAARAPTMRAGVNQRLDRPSREDATPSPAFTSSVIASVSSTSSTRAGWYAPAGSSTCSAAVRSPPSAGRRTAFVTHLREPDAGLLREPVVLSTQSPPVRRRTRGARRDGDRGPACSSARGRSCRPAASSRGGGSLPRRCGPGPGETSGGNAAAAAAASDSRCSTPS